MARIVIAFYDLRPYIVMAYMVMAYIVMAFYGLWPYIVMAYTVLARMPGGARADRGGHISYGTLVMAY